MKKIWVAFLALAALPLAAQAPFVVVDLNDSFTYALSSEPGAFAATADSALFFAQHPDEGAELRRVTNGQLALVEDINPGGSSSNYHNASSLWRIAPGVFLFAAIDGVHGQELWRTDGTETGTYLVKDLQPGDLGSGVFVRAVRSDGKALLVAGTSTHGTELWVSDGTEAGTQVIELTPGTGHVTFGDFVPLGGLHYFSTPGKLWKTDGTAAGTTQVATTFSIRGLVSTGTRLFFVASGTGHGLELWTSDGTTAGTVRISDINPGAGSAFGPEVRIMPAGDGVVFLAYDGSGHEDLWKSDGTAGGTQFVEDVLGENDHSGMVAVLGSSLGLAFFRAMEVGGGGGVWRSDGTAAGTFIIDPRRTAAPGVEAFGRFFYLAWDNDDSLLLRSTDGTVSGGITVYASGEPIHGSLPSLVFAEGKLYFSGSSPLHGQEPWVSDGTAAGTHMLANVAPDPPPSSDPNELHATGGQLFFRGIDETASQFMPVSQLWRTDGTAGGTRKVTSYDGTTSVPLLRYYTPWNGSLYYEWPHNGWWKSDGTLAGTVPLTEDFAPDELKIAMLFPTSGYLYLAGRTTGESTDGLWRTDGTPGGTIELTAGVDGPRILLPSRITELAGRVYFTAGDQGLWVTQGTSATTKQVVPFDSEMFPAPYQYGGSMVASGGALYYSAGTQDVELWRSDSTVGGTELTKDIRPGVEGSFPAHLTPAGRYVYFVANDGTHGRELWRTDGTAAGTILLADINAGTGDGSPAQLTAFGEMLFFTIDDGVHGVELWRSDGTVAGTVMVADIRPGSDSSAPAELASVDNALWFSADDGLYGRELWRVTGTNAPVLYADIEPGPGSSSPRELVESNRLLYFSAETRSIGRELYAIQLATSAFSIGDVRVVEGNSGTTVARFPVTRSGNTSGSASVTFATGRVTASAGVDFVSRSGTLTFAAGQASGLIDIAVNGDTVAEDRESFLVKLGSAAGAGIARAYGFAIIEDDDQRVDLRVEFVRESSSAGTAEVPRIVRITNDGPSAASEVTLEFSESPYRAAVSTGNCFVYTPELLRCAVSPILSGQSIDVMVIRLNVTGIPNSPDRPGHTIHAAVSSVEPELDPSDNSVTRMVSRDGTLDLPLVLVAGESRKVVYHRPSPATSQVGVSLNSSLNVTVTPAIITLQPGQQEATFTVNVGPQTGMAMLQASGGSVMTIPIVATAGTVAKQDVVIVVPPVLSVQYGEPVDLPIQVAARTPDGLLPTGIVQFIDENDGVVDQEILDGNAAAVFRPAGLAPGTYSWRVRYLGDTKFNAFDEALALASAIVNGYPTTISFWVPPMICAGTTRELVFLVRTTATTAAPAGSLRLSLDSNPEVTLPLTPTGVPGQSRAVYTHTFVDADRYLSVSYLPQSPFAPSGEDEVLDTRPCGAFNFSATTVANGVSLQWTSTGAHHYEVRRYRHGSWFVFVSSVAGTSFLDTGAEQGTAYLYTVCGMAESGGFISCAAPDLATFMAFTDPPLVQKVTPARAAHITELRAAVAALRLLAAGEYTDAEVMPPGTLIRAAHINQLRTAINGWRHTLGLPPYAFTDASLAKGMSVKALHIQQLRDSVK